MSPKLLDKQLNVVADVHDDVWHTWHSIAADIVWSPILKRSPLTVNVALPLCMAFRVTSDATAASKLKVGCPVPDSVAKVTPRLP
jgi:hypothetical protein